MYKYFFVVLYGCYKHSIRVNLNGWTRRMYYNCSSCKAVAMFALKSLWPGGLEEVLLHLRPSFEAADGRILGACALLAMRLSARVLLCRESLSSLQKLRCIAEKQLLLQSSPKKRTWWGRLSGRFSHEQQEPLGAELQEAAQEAAEHLGAEALLDSNRLDSKRLLE